jgi:hypothetical protein
MLEETHDTEEIIQRVAALDIGKAELVCCVRVPSPGTAGKRLQEIQTYQTMTRALLVLADRLGELGVTRVVMEATPDYWKAPFYLLEAEAFEVWLVNAHDVKHLPGRPRPTGWTRCGCARSPSGRCCAPASSHHPRSASYETRPATGPIWWRRGPRRRTVWRSFWRTSRSS